MNVITSVSSRQETGKKPSLREPYHDHPCTITSSELLNGRRELWIEHGNDLYRLRLTSAGKLYLTK